MKGFFIVLTFCSLLQADQQEVIIQVQNLAQQSTDRQSFIDAITRIEKGKRSSILDLSQQVSPRLHATLQQATTSLVFTDDQLDQKLHELKLEQNLLFALEAKNLDGALQAIDDGADANTATSAGHTALMLAVLKADQDAVIHLLNQNARVKDKGAFLLNPDSEVEQMNALDLAQRRNYQPIVQILKKALS